MPHFIGVIIDEKRMEKIKGTPLEKEIKDMFGGALKMIAVPIPEEKSKEVLKAFDKARIDSRGYIEDVPVAFRRAVFEEMIKAKSLNIIDNVLARISEIQEAAKKEDEYIPPPEVE